MSNDRYDKALRTPTEIYDHPAAVLKDDAMSGDQKREILRHWKSEAVELQQSEGEGMGGGERSLLTEIEDALHELGGG